MRAAAMQSRTARALAARWSTEIILPDALAQFQQDSVREGHRSDSLLQRREPAFQLGA